MSRKIWKILISLLFLVVAAVAAVFTIKIFSHDKPTSTPVQMVEEGGPYTVRPKGDERVTTKYGVGPITRPGLTQRYGVVGIGRSRK